MNRDEQLKILQEEECKLLFAFVDICEKEGYRYFLVEGSMLGAIRHQDIIPWDDDIDVGMPRKDYEDFISTYKNKTIGELYQLSYLGNTTDCNRVYAQLKSNRIKVKLQHTPEAYYSNAWIDIFPLDGVPENKFARYIYKINWKLRRYIFVMSNFSTSTNVIKSDRPLYEKIVIAICQAVPFWKMINSKKAYDSYHKFLRKYPYDMMPYIINAISAYKDRAIIPKEVFGNGKYYLFHNHRVMGPKDGHSYCKMIYGDYMTPPPVEQRNWHQSEIFIED